MTKLTSLLSVKCYHWLAALALVAVCSFNSIAQISTSVTMSAVPIAGSPFASFSAAITAVNGLTITGPVVVDATAGQTETAPNGGYTITATGTVTNTITIQRTGAGANPTLTANAALTSGVLHDAIIEITGGDYITIDGFTMLENAGNTTTTAGSNNMTEWGVAVNYASATNGCQNITIKNCTIDLNRTYQNTFGIYANSTHTATTVTTSATATGANGGTHNLTITGNSIIDVNQGIVVVGPTAIADVNTGIVIGGSAPNANTITNYGTTGTFSGYANVSGTVNGILVRNSNGFNVSHNTVSSSVGGTTSGTLNGIQQPASTNAPTGTFTNTISNNNISLQSAVASGAMNGINVPSGSASSTSTLNLDNNNFNTFGHTVAASGTITFILNASTHPTTTFNNNTFTNITVNTTGSVIFFSYAPTLTATGVMNINGNSIVTGFSKTGAGNNVTIWTSNASSVAGSVETFNNNNFSNITLTGATTFVGYSNTDGPSGGGPTKTITGNTFSNITGGTNSVTCMTVGFSTSANISGNTINNISGGGAVTGMVITSVNQTVNQNTIRTMSSTGASAVIGISVTAGTTNNITRNTICDLSGSNSGSTVNGILVSSGTTANLSNNRIGDLRTTAANAANPLIGINVTGGTNVNAYYNTVYLNGSSSGALFGSSALSASTTPTLTLNNNLLVNTSTASGAGVISAYRRSSTTLTSYGATSDRNDLYAATLFFDGTNNITTISAYKTHVAARDANSISVSSSFLSTACGNANFLKIDPAVASQVESGGANISGITDDFENEVRQGNPGYLTQVNGGGTAPDIGADEYDGIPAPVCTGTPAASTISGSSPLCSGNGTTLSLSTLYTDVGITFQWQSSAVSGGPYVNMGTGATQATGNLAGTTYYICTITCTNSGLFFTTSEFTVTVNPAQATSVTPSSASFCAGGSTPLLANGESYTVTGTLEGSQEVPPVSPSGSGVVNAVYNAVTNVLTMNVYYTGLTSNVTAAHIHGPAAPGVNAGVLYGITPGIVALGGTSGNLTGTVTLSAGDETSLFSGLLYVNLHTVNNGGGEVRAQLTATLNTPSAYLWSPALGLSNTTIANPTANPTTSTVYTVQVTGTGGCTATNTTSITVNQLPAAATGVAGYTLCQGGTIPGGSGLTASSSQTVTSFTGSLAVGPTYNRGQGNSQTTYSASGTGTAVYYNTHTFTVSATGAYVFNQCAAGYDGYGTLYTTSFTPASPATNFLRGDDDTNGTPTCSGSPNSGSDARLSVTLNSGVTYVLVSTSFNNGTTGAYTWTFTGPGTVQSSGGTLLWYTVPTNGTSFASGSPLDPIGVLNSGVPNSNTPGTTPFYVAVYDGTCESTRIQADLIIEATPTADADDDQTICSDGTATLAGSVGGSATGGTWSTAGDGTFAPNATTLNAVYTPGANDITNGSVVLTLTTSGSVDCSPVNDNMTLTINAAATANAGGNATVCETSPAYTLSGATATNNTGVTWSTAGDGTFAPDNITLNATYTPGTNDLANGSVQLTLTATGNAPCGNAVSNMTLTIEDAPTADAGTDADACATGYQLSGSVGGSATGGTWSTAGDGTFAPNNTTLNATYIAGANDITNGSVVLTLTTSGSVACTPDADNVTLTIINTVPATPTAITGAPVSVCPPSAPFTLSTTSAGASSYNWTLGPSTTGVNFLTANGSSSIDVEFVSSSNSTYTIRVNGVNVCGSSAAFAAVTVRRSVSTPAAVIGDAFACANDVKTYSHAAVTGATSYQWTAPAGCFFDGNPLNVSPYVTNALSVSVTFPPGYAGGNVGVAAQVACFTSPTKNLVVNPAPPVPSVISGITSVCSPQSGVVYSVVNTPGLTYNWTAPPNASVTSGQGSNSITVNYLATFSGGQLKVSASSACGTSTERKLNILITGGSGGITPRPTAITGQLVNLCGATGVVLTASPNVGSATYNFSTTVPGAIVTPGPGNNQATFDFPTGWVNATVSVTQQNACATVSLPRTVDVKSKPGNPIITGPVSVITNQAGVVYSIPAITPAPSSITWGVPSGASITAGQGTNSITVTFGPNPGSGNIVVNQNNTCGNSTGVLGVTINPVRISGTEINGTTPLDFVAYPNPADEFVMIRFNALQEGKASVELRDLSGKLLSVKVTDIAEGVNESKIDVSTLAKGMYIMNVMTPGGNVQTRISVQ